MKHSGWLCFGFLLGLVSTSFNFQLSSGELLAPIRLIPGLFVVAIGIVFLRYLFWLVKSANNAR